MVGEGVTRHTVPVQRMAIWLARLTALAAIAVGTFLDSPAYGTTLLAQVIVFGIGAVLLLTWGGLVLARAAHPTAGRLLPGVLAGMAVCAAPCTSTNGGALIVFGVMAAIGAGSESTLAFGWVVTALAASATVIGASVVGAGTTATLGYSLLLVLGLLIGNHRRWYRLQAEDASALIAQSKRLREQQEEVAVLGERNRIAREIHDVLAHSLGALSIQIQTARALLSDQHDVERSLALLDAAQRMAIDGLAETRRAVHALRTDRRPLPEELSALVDNQHDRVLVELDVRGRPRPLAPDAELALLRTAQESFVNAAKHAAGHPVRAQLSYAQAHTTLTITNPLPAAHEASRTAGINGGYGLVGMRERLLLLGGSLTAEPACGRWTVTAVVPQ